MIEHFFISKVRVKILRLYLQGTQKSYHVRDIVRKVKEEINAVRRELINLEKAGLFRKEPQFNRVYYILNEEYPLIPELRGMLFKEYGLGGTLIKEKDQLGSVAYAILSSNFIFLRSMNPNLLDLLVIGEGVNMERLAVMVRSAELDMQREINYAVLSREQFDTQRKREDAFLKTFLEKPKLFLLGREDALLSD